MSGGADIDLESLVTLSSLMKQWQAGLCTPSLCSP
jgi:hypothetical protein